MGIVGARADHRVLVVGGKDVQPEAFRHLVTDVYAARAVAVRISPGEKTPVPIYGICVPLLFIVLASAEVEARVADHHALTIIAEEIGYGIVGEVAAGVVSGAIVVLAGRRGLITASLRQVVPVAAAALAYGVAAALGGSGFIAAFLAGGIARRETQEAGRLSEEIGSLLDGVTFVIFGAVLLGPALSHLSWTIALYAALCLTVVRLLPVAIAMYGTGARARTVAFVGWFGPRGLARSSSPSSWCRSLRCRTPARSSSLPT